MGAPSPLRSLILRNYWKQNFLIGVENHVSFKFYTTQLRAPWHPDMPGVKLAEMPRSWEIILRRGNEVANGVQEWEEPQQHPLHSYGYRDVNKLKGRQSRRLVVAVQRVYMCACIGYVFWEARMSGRSVSFFFIYTLTYSAEKLGRIASQLLSLRRSLYPLHSIKGNDTSILRE